MTTISTEEKLQACQDYLRKLMWYLDTGVMGSGMTLCRECHSLKGENHKHTCQLAKLLDEPMFIEVTKQVEKLLGLIATANKIYQDNNLSANEKHDMICAMNIEEKIAASGFSLDEWYNPDYNFEEFMKAFMDTLYNWARKNFGRVR